MAKKRWRKQEVEAAVEDYFDMLALELRGQEYNKTAHCDSLQTRLDGRTKGAVERKHQSISTVLKSMGLPFIDGYKHYGKASAMVRDVVHERSPYVVELLAKLAKDASSEQLQVVVDDVLDMLVEAPEAGPLVAGDEQADYIAAGGGNGVVDYVRQEERNQSLGDAGECLVMQYEQARLRREGKDHLACKVEWVAKTVGDHAGYDIRSYDADSGSELFLEVKTTRHGLRTPFYISPGELRFSKANAHAYWLYRMFDLSGQPKLFRLPGDVTKHVRLLPAQYRALF